MSKKREISIGKATLSDTWQIVIGNKVAFLSLQEMVRLKMLINGIGELK